MVARSFALNSTTTGPGTPEPFGVPRRETSGGAVVLPALRHVPRKPPQHPLQLLASQPAPEPPPRVLLGSLDECRTEALVQAGATVLIGVRGRCTVFHPARDPKKVLRRHYSAYHLVRHGRGIPPSIRPDPNAKNPPPED